MTKGLLTKLWINYGLFCHHFVSQHLVTESTLGLEEVHI